MRGSSFGMYMSAALSPGKEEGDAAPLIEVSTD